MNNNFSYKCIISRKNPIIDLWGQKEQLMKAIGL